jgi:hypothetical protein
MFHGSSKASSNAVQAAASGLDDPRGLTSCCVLQIALYTHRSQAGRTSSNRPGVETPDYPAPRIGVIILRGSYASTQAHLYAHVQQIVVDLEEPRTLRPTIGWPASGAMRHPAYGLLRILLPRTSVNKPRPVFRSPPGGIIYGVDPVEKVELASGEEEAPVSAEEKNKALPGQRSGVGDGLAERVMIC